MGTNCLALRQFPLEGPKLHQDVAVRHSLGATGQLQPLFREAQRFATQLLTVIEAVIAAVYAARRGAPPPAGAWLEEFAPQLKALLDASLGDRPARRRGPRTERAPARFQT